MSVSVYTNAYSADGSFQEVPSRRPYFTDCSYWTIMQKRAARERLATHFSLLDREDDFEPVARRFVLLYGEGYCTSWDTLDEARVAFPIQTGYILKDTLTSIFWTTGGVFR